MPVLTIVVLVLVSLALLALLGAFAYDIVKRPVHTYHWLAPLVLAMLIVEPVQAWWPRYNQSITGVAFLVLLQAALLATSASACLVLLGISRRLRPDAEVESRLRAPILLAAVVGALLAAPLPFLGGQEHAVVAALGWVAVAFVALFSAEGGHRLASGRRTAASLLVVSAVAVLVANVAGGIGTFLPRAVVLPDARLGTDLAVAAGAVALLVLLARQLGITMARGPLAVLALLAGAAGLHTVIVVGTVAFGMPSGLPVRWMAAQHDSVQAGTFGVVLTPWGRWIEFRSSRRGDDVLRADRSACSLPLTFHLNRGTASFHFRQFASGVAPVLRTVRDENGWWLGEDGPYPDEAVYEALESFPPQRLSFVPSPHATLQQVVDVCTHRPGDVCALDPDTRLCPSATSAPTNDTGLQR